MVIHKIWQTFLADMSLRRKLVLAFLAVSLLFGTLLVFFSNWTMKGALNQMVGADLHNLANSKALTVGNRLGRQIDVLHALSLNHALHARLKEVNVGYRGDAAAIQAELADRDRQWLTAANNAPLIQSIVQDPLAAELRLFQSRFPDHVEVFLTDRYGGLVAATERTEDYYQADESWWSQAYAQETGGAYIDTLAWDPSSATLGVRIAVPVFDNSDDPLPLGLLVSIYRMNALSLLIAATSTEQVGLEARLLFPNGQVLAENGQALIPLSPADQIRLEAMTAPYTRQPFEGKQRFVSLALVTTMARDPAIINLGWQVLIYQDQQAALAPLIAQQVINLGVTAAAIVISALVGAWMAYGLSRPIVHLTAAAQRIAAGDMAATAPIEGRDEIGVLAMTFNEMMARLFETLIELQAGEARFRSYIESAPLGIFEVDAQGHYLMVNPAACRMIGYTETELLPLSIRELTAPEAQDGEARFCRLVQEGRMTEEVILAGQGGRRIPVLLEAVRLDAEHYLGFCTDISERKQAEVERERLLKQLQESEYRIRQIMNTVPEGVALLDADLRVQLCNPAARAHLQTLTERRADDCAGPLTHLGDLAITELLTSPPKGLWHTLVYAGRHFQVIARAVEIGPMMRGWVLAIRDVTNEYEVQERLQRQERLAVVGQLAAGIAHDFNNILAGIVLYSQMSLRMPNLPPKLHERLTVIAEQSRRAADLIAQILDFSRRAVLERQPLDLTPLLKEQVKLWERTLPETIHIKLVSADGDYLVNADLTRIQQVLMNLVVNARDALPDGGHLTVSLARIQVTRTQPAPLPELSAGEWIEIAVSDTGAGIPDAVLPHIFEPFFTTKEPGKGTGLGLAQVYGIVKAHEGHIGVQTQVGAGTTFTLYLPVLPVSESAPRLALSAELPLGHGETILVVEDNPVTRAAVLDSLELLHYHALEASDGNVALALFAAQRTEIVLVLTDMVMPEMGGKALAQVLHQQASALPVVLMSGHPLEQEQEILSAAGVAGWIQKPPDLTQLAEVLARALHNAAKSGVPV